MEQLNHLAAELERHLQEVILSFWTGRMQDGRGGFHGRFTGDGIMIMHVPGSSSLTRSSLTATARKAQMPSSRKMGSVYSVPSSGSTAFASMV